MNQGKGGIKISAILNLIFSIGLLVFGLLNNNKGFILFCIIIIIININTLKNLYKNKR